MGPGPVSHHHPFHCWTSFRTSPILSFLTFMTGRGPYTGEYTSCPRSPVSLLDVERARNARHTFRWETPECQKDQKDTSLANDYWRTEHSGRFWESGENRTHSAHQPHLPTYSHFPDRNAQTPPNSPMVLRGSSAVKRRARTLRGVWGHLWRG